jgi:hypothetical protein
VVWYADGDSTVLNEYNLSIAYAFGGCSSARFYIICLCLCSYVEGIIIFGCFLLEMGDDYMLCHSFECK